MKVIMYISCRPLSTFVQSDNIHVFRVKLKEMVFILTWTFVQSNKGDLQQLILARFSSLVQCFWIRPVAYPKLDHLNLYTDRLWPCSQTLAKWKGLLGTNTQAYWAHLSVTEKINYYRRQVNQVYHWRLFSKHI